MNEGVLFPVVLSAGSGTGKTTVAQEVQRANPERFCISVSATTRPPRGKERDAVDYHFFDEGQFLSMVESGGFLEWAVVHDHYYGTPRSEVEHGLSRGRIVLLDIDIQGGCEIMSTLSEAVSIFLLPPNKDELVHRLRSRGTEDEEKIKLRIENAQYEIERGMETYDYLVVNDVLEECVSTVTAIIKAEQMKRWRIEKDSSLYRAFHGGIKQ